MIVANPKRFAVGVLGALAVAVAPLPAQSHPHVAIEAHSDVVFDDTGKIIAVNVEWAFDEFYSVTAVEGLDANNNGKFEPSEINGVIAENIKELKAFRYFTQVNADGKPVPYSDVTEYGSQMKDDILTMYFRIPFAEPVDPIASKVTYRMYDPEFYIAIEYPAKGGVNIVGKAPKHCKMAIAKAEADAEDLGDQGEAFYEKMASTKEIGALYAERVSVVCAPAAS